MLWFRRFVINFAMDRGADLGSVAAFLGHESPAVTYRPRHILLAGLIHPTIRIGGGCRQWPDTATTGRLRRACPRLRTPS